MIQDGNSLHLRLSDLNPSPLPLPSFLCVHVLPVADRKGVVVVVLSRIRCPRVPWRVDDAHSR